MLGYTLDSSMLSAMNGASPQERKTKCLLGYQTAAHDMVFAVFAPHLTEIYVTAKKVLPYFRCSLRDIPADLGALLFGNGDVAFHHKLNLIANRSMTENQIKEAERLIKKLPHEAVVMEELEVFGGEGALAGPSEELEVVGDEEALEGPSGAADIGKGLSIAGQSGVGRRVINDTDSEEEYS
ncbi:hypothetical protein Bhyg_08411 [Pseudolycoriella hygida]|uniref:Uncharacterized protein n=1 Tax=Pseudolycoriella hygida TaxID=35572 RepID=A0A9Q0S4T3_9DIPT|nr:hypothetical protein Bhyg_08411 [Pseudolycoriella hygida]